MKRIKNNKEILENGMCLCKICGKTTTLAGHYKHRKSKFHKVIEQIYRNQMKYQKSIEKTKNRSLMYIK